MTVEYAEGRGLTLASNPRGGFYVPDETKSELNDKLDEISDLIDAALDAELETRPDGLNLLRLGCPQSDRYLHRRLINQPVFAVYRSHFAHHACRLELRLHRLRERKRHRPEQGHLSPVVTKHARYNIFHAELASTYCSGVLVDQGTASASDSQFGSCVRAPSSRNRTKPRSVRYDIRGL
jgi:hypothetical protein